MHLEENRVADLPHLPDPSRVAGVSGWVKTMRACLASVIARFLELLEVKETGPILNPTFEVPEKTPFTPFP